MSEKINIAGKQVTFAFEEEPPTTDYKDGIVIIPHHAKVDVISNDTEDKQKITQLVQSPGVTVGIPTGASDGESKPFKTTNTTEFIGLGLLGIANAVSLNNTKPPKYLEEMLLKTQDEWGWEVTFTAWTSVVNPLKAAKNVFRYKANKIKQKLRK